MDEDQLEKFVAAQEPVYAQALAELRRGRKQSHWMWFVFPQLAGLGRSATAQHYAIRSLAEARSYAGHPLLGRRLRECTSALLAHDGLSAETILGTVDALKLRSSMTLFAVAAPEERLFADCLDAFYGGEPDSQTLRLLGGDAR